MKKIFLFLCIIVISLSCKKNKDDGVKDPEPFIINTSFMYVQDFLFLSNQKGEVVFQINELGFGKNDIFRVDGLDKNDVFDLTFGYGRSNFAGVTTIRDVKSDFNWSIFSDCEFEFLQGTRDDMKYIKLTIEGIDDFDELIFQKSEVTTDIEKNDSSIVLSSIVLFEDDYVITILPKGETKYKSYLLKNNEWIADLNNEYNVNYHLSINFNDFNPSIVHDVSVSKAGEYKIKAELIDPTEGVTLLKYWEKDVFQNGDVMRFFTTPEVEIEKIRLYVQTITPDSKYVYQKILTDFPESIDYFETEMELNATNEQFDFVVSNSNNFSEIEYRGGNNNNSYWNIYQKETSSNYSLPIFPKDILELYKSVEKLTKPNLVRLHAYEKDDRESDFDDKKFHFPRCDNFTSRTISVDL